ncbi:MAG: ferredoxin [Desulfuromonas sp.]|nr:MAG: ferredoxin [Desulfuromonas sp.]
MAVTILNCCTGCGACVAACPLAALTLMTERPGGYGRRRAFVRVARCTDCGACVPSCPHLALELPTLG